MTEILKILISQESQSQHEEAESSLKERREEYEKLMAKFDVATKETERLLKEIDEFNALKNTAEAKISSLERDLQKSLLEKEEIRNTESQKTLELKAQLSEEVFDKKKQIKALEDALDEIQRLKETIKTERKNTAGDDLKEDVGTFESLKPVIGVRMLIEKEVEKILKFRNFSIPKFQSSKYIRVSNFLLSKLSSFQILQISETLENEN